MSWIALKMLVGDRAKFLGIVMGLTFAALLITQQGSIFCGLMLRTAGQVTDITGADLWVMDHSVRYIDDVKPMLESNLYRVRGVEGVRWAVPLYKGNARVKVNPLRQDADKPTTIEQVILLGLDDASLVGAPPPERILVGRLLDLRKTDAVIVDYTRLGKLYPDDMRGDLERLIKEQGKDKGQRTFYARFLNRELEMNDHRAVIVGICEATRTFQSNPVVYTTYSRAKRFSPQERKILSYVLVKTEEGTTPGAVADRIEKKTGLRARTSDQFMLDTIMYYLKYTGIPINFGITAMLGFLVGTAIAGQTFYNFTLENLKQFGALKAMGASNVRIVKMILLQALVVGLLGYGIGVGLAMIFGWANQSPQSNTHFFLPLWVCKTFRLPYENYTVGDAPLFGPSPVHFLFHGVVFLARKVVAIGPPALVATAAADALLLVLYLARLIKWDSFRQTTVVVTLAYVATSLAAAFYAKQGMTGSELAFYTWWPILPVTGGAVVLICILSSLLSIRRVIVLEPAVVFRG
jgi:putative ABC transport system permease protein